MDAFKSYNNNIKTDNCTMCNSCMYIYCLSNLTKLKETNPKFYEQIKELSTKFRNYADNNNSDNHPN